MRTFKISVNKKLVCTAGLDGDCVLSAIIDHVSKWRRLHLSVGGLNTLAGEHVRWVDRNLRVGDEIRIRIANAGRADKPVKRFPRDPSKERESMKRYVRQYAKQLGWKIKEKN